MSSNINTTINRFAHFFYQPCMPLGPDGRLATGSKEHIALSHEAALEGMVLLKNEGSVLPLKKGTHIALFGTAQFDYVRGGGGSGDVTTAYTRNIYEGFMMKQEQGLVEVFQPVSELYRSTVEEQKARKGEGARCDEPELEEKLMDEAAEFTDTAVFALCRYSWENGDRKGEKGDGDYYLNAGEERTLKALLKKFKHIIVVLDVGGTVDTAWFKDTPAIDGVLMAWQAGIEGGLAIADTVCGLSNPSGRLVDTFPDSFDAYPSSEHFGDSREYVDYTEDVFVGYRYFVTFPEAAEHVIYPFGYGLSYTTFETAAESVHVPTADELTAYLSGKTGISPAITVRARVTNTGSVAGKNAVGLYYAAPKAAEGKAAKELAAFGKTKLLAPGESDVVTMSFAVSDMAYFDDLGKFAKSAYVLAEGEYGLYLGADVREAKKLEAVYVQPGTVVTCRLSSKCAPHNLKERLTRSGVYEELPADKAPAQPRTTVYNCWTTPTGRTIVGDIKPALQIMGTLDPEGEGHRNDEVPELKNVIDGKMTAMEFTEKLPIEVRIELLGGQPNTGVANTFSMGGFGEFGIPFVPTADGPAGLRINPGLGVSTTAWPIATMLACTWNTDLVEKVGAAGALETKENHIGLWLTPAMNIHRSPLCGRNFEYYSEDPLITGKMGAAMIRGIQSQRIGATMKHFACNNKEEDRFVCDSRVSERALRQIYLKGFEIAVREAMPWVVMSSYNILNGVYTSRSRELLTDILRDEWGFTGMVTTDWMNRSGHSYEVQAGNDLKMPIGEPKELLEAYKSGELSEADINTCACRIIETILKFD